MPIDCDECRGIGDDYRIEDGELVSNCDECINYWASVHQTDCSEANDEEVSGDE